MSITELYQEISFLRRTVDRLAPAAGVTWADLAREVAEDRTVVAGGWRGAYVDILAAATDIEKAGARPERVLSSLVLPGED